LTSFVLKQPERCAYIGIALFPVVQLSSVDRFCALYKFKPVLVIWSTVDESCGGKIWKDGASSIFLGMLLLFFHPLTIASSDNFFFINLLPKSPLKNLLLKQ